MNFSMDQSAPAAEYLALVFKACRTLCQLFLENLPNFPSRGISKLTTQLEQVKDYESCNRGLAVLMSQAFEGLTLRASQEDKDSSVLMSEHDRPEGTTRFKIKVSRGPSLPVRGTRQSPYQSRSKHDSDWRYRGQDYQINQYF
jgi:hypothetical protein